MRTRRILPAVRITKEDIIIRIKERKRMRIVSKKMMVNFVVNQLGIDIKPELYKMEVYQILEDNLNLDTFDLYAKHDILRFCQADIINVCHASYKRVKELLYKKGITYKPFEYHFESRYCVYYLYDIYDILSLNGERV